MSTYDEREKAFEAKYAADKEKMFRIESLRSKKVGYWAAELLGLSGEEAEEYAKSAVRADLDEPGYEDLFRKIRADLDAAGVHKTDQDIYDVIADSLEEAEKELC